jgi:hypothetical protein
MDLVLPGGAGLIDTLFGEPDSYLGSSNATHPNATEDDLITALAALERGDIEFVILQDTPNKTFMQTTGGPAEGYYLEYNDGSPDYNYRARATLSGTQLTEALVAFLHGDPSWKTVQAWEKFKL